LILVINLKKIRIVCLLLGHIAFFSSSNLLVAANLLQSNFPEEEDLYANSSPVKNETINKPQKKKDVSSFIQKDFYLIGPGDILTLNLFDAPEFSGDYPVLNDGTIQLPLIKTIYVNNLSIEQASTIIENKYRDQLLRPELHLTVKVPRPILVSVIGEIERPGIYSLTRNEKSILAGGPQISNNGLPTIVDAIQKAGGITQNANLTKVIINRKLPGKKNELKQTNINLVDLLFEGDHLQNLFLFDGDVIKLTKAEKVSPDIMKIARANLSPSIIKVRVIGQVQDPGLINLSANTPLVQAVLSAGGPLSWKADKGNVELLRVNQNGKIIKKNYKIDLSEHVSYDKNPPLKDRDIIYVKSSLLNKVNTGLGAVTEPFAPLINAMTLFRLLN